METPDETQVRRILDVALRFGQLLLACQAGTADVATTIASITSVYGLRDMHVDVTGNSITISVPRGVPGAPVTAMYLEEARAADYTRLQLATDLAQRIADTRPDLSWVQEQLDELEQADHPYPRWVSTAGLGVMAGGFAVLLGAGPAVALLATATTAMIDRVGRVLNRWHLPFLFQRVVGATIATSVAIAITTSGWLPEETPASPVVAANIVALLSGLAIVGCFQDAVTGYQLTALTRMMDIALSSTGILVGVGLAIRLGSMVGAQAYVSVDISFEVQSVPVRVLAGAVGAAGAAVASYSSPRATTAAAAAGAVGSLIYFGLVLSGNGPVASSFVAAAVIGFGAAAAASWLRVTPLVIITAGIIPLVPGLTLFRGFVQLMRAQGNAAEALGTAAGTALALGAGVVLGPLLAPSVQRELARSRRLLRSGSVRRIPQLAGIHAPTPRRLHLGRRPRSWRPAPPKHER